LSLFNFAAALGMIQSIYNKFRRITSNQLYFPEIDGIRFLAIVLVVLFHIHGFFIAKTAIMPTGIFERGLSLLLTGGSRGVELFFVLSGFILCLPFAHQHINNGKQVSLKHYYLRRVTRLEPPYFLAMIGVFIIMAVMQTYPFALLVKCLLTSLTYTYNIIVGGAPLLNGVTWSLEIEIQFYLMAPALFLILRLNKPARRLILIAICLLFTVFQRYYTPATNTIYYHLQYFVAGILLADLYVSGELLNAKNSLTATLAAGVLFLLVLLLPLRADFGAKLAYPFIVCVFYLLIMRNDVLKCIFSFGFLPIIGGMCYSIYLLHYPIVSFAGRFVQNIRIGEGYTPNLLVQIVLISSAILAISAVFYILVERPFMSSKWTDKLMKKDKHEPDINPVAIPEGDTTKATK
jgi:peptidoglycan/LPS O-acetylase OafA/YrhL